MSASTRDNGREDTHFYLDNAPPTEVVNVLRILSEENPLTLDGIAASLADNCGFEMQQDRTYSPRRLLDLGLATRSRDGSKVTNRLSQLGKKVQGILSVDAALATDILHYLHYTGYRRDPSDRKYLWSYRRCCVILWSHGKLLSPREMAAAILAEMKTEFPRLDVRGRVGFRFNSTAASCVSTWLRSLEPPPIGNVGEALQPRTIDRFELALLALDDVYRNRGYRHGDPVLVDDELVDHVSAVFFLERSCCNSMLRLSSRISKAVKITDTLAGPSITLLRPFSIHDL